MQIEESKNLLNSSDLCTKVISTDINYFIKHNDITPGHNKKINSD